MESASFNKLLTKMRRVAYPCGCTRSLYDDGIGEWASVKRACQHGWVLGSVLKEGEKFPAWVKHSPSLNYWTKR